MSPYPIKKVTEQTEVPTNESQNIVNLLPLLQLPMFGLQDILNSSKDKEIIKKIWYACDTVEQGKLRVSSKVSKDDVNALKAHGLIDVSNDVIAFTDKGMKLLRESILNDEKSSLTKTASKTLISKNSWDFGEEVLVKINHPEKFGSKYIRIAKSNFANKSQQILEYKIATRKPDGNYRDIKDYSEKELIQVLHLAKNIINNRTKVKFAANEIAAAIPINRIKAFAEMILKELNNR